MYIVRESYVEGKEPKKELQCERCQQWKSPGAFKFNRKKDGKFIRGRVCRRNCVPVPTMAEIVEEIAALKERIDELESLML